MKKKIYLALFFSFLFIIIVSFGIVKYTFANIKDTFSKKYYLGTIQEYNIFLNKDKVFLKSISEYLANSNITLKAYVENNKSYIIKAYLPLYKSLFENDLIDEMHFFKIPVENFVAFANLKLADINLSNARKDIALVNSSLKSAVYFYICRNYPGLRATYPIIHNYKIYGSVSIGSNLINFKNMFEKIDMPTTVYLNDKLLKKSLKSDKYAFYTKYPLYKGYRVIGKNYKVNFKNKYEVKNEELYVIIPIRDLFHNTMAYMVVKRDLSSILEILKINAIKNFLFDFIIFFVMFGMFIILFKYIYKRFEELKEILDLIKNKQFEKVYEHKVSKIKDEFDICKNNLVDVAKHLSLYIKILTNEKDYYSKKAYIDELTSVYNRNFLEEKAEEITEKIKITKESLGVMIFDIDNFKQINDTYGHDIGDLVLNELATNIKQLLRKEDMFIRYGGEEFVILFPNTLFKDVITIAQKIRKVVEKLPIKIPKETLHITISIGVSEFSKDDETIFDVIKRADKKLYEAKRSGKNRVIY